MDDGGRRYRRPLGEVITRRYNFKNLTWESKPQKESDTPPPAKKSKLSGNQAPLHPKKTRNLQRKKNLAKVSLTSVAKEKSEERVLDASSMLSIRNQKRLLHSQQPIISHDGIRPRPLSKRQLTSCGEKQGPGDHKGPGNHEESTKENDIKATSYQVTRSRKYRRRRRPWTKHYKYKISKTRTKTVKCAVQDSSDIGCELGPTEILKTTLQQRIPLLKMRHFKTDIEQSMDEYKIKVDLKYMIPDFISVTVQPETLEAMATKRYEPHTVLLCRIPDITSGEYATDSSDQREYKPTTYYRDPRLLLPPPIPNISRCRRRKPSVTRRIVRTITSSDALPEIDSFSDEPVCEEFTEPPSPAVIERVLKLVEKSLHQLAAIIGANLRPRYNSTNNLKCTRLTNGLCMGLPVCKSIELVYKVVWNR